MQLYTYSLSPLLSPMGTLCEEITSLIWQEPQTEIKDSLDSCEMIAYKLDLGGREFTAKYDLTWAF